MNHGRQPFERPTSIHSLYKSRTGPSGSNSVCTTHVSSCLEPKARETHFVVPAFFISVYDTVLASNTDDVGRVGEIFCKVLEKIDEQLTDAFGVLTFLPDARKGVEVVEEGDVVFALAFALLVRFF